MTLHSRWIDSARKCLTKTCIALNAANLRFIPATGRPPGLTEDVRERAVVLSQVIYLESYMFLAVDGTEPKMTVRIEKEFRHDLQVNVHPSLPLRDLMVVAQQTYPHLFEICPLIMRTQGILLVRDAVLIMSFCSADSKLSYFPVRLIDPLCFVTGVKPDRWKQIRDDLVTRLDEYSNTLLRNVRTFLQIGDTQGAEIIQSSCVGCLAHLAVLCDLISRSEPNSKLRMDTICDSSLERLGRLTEDMSFDGYTYFDLLLRVWSPGLPLPNGERADNVAD